MAGLSRVAPFALAWPDDPASSLMPTCVTTQIARLVGDWDRRRAGRAFPARGDFDVQDFRYIIGSLSLVSVLPDHAGFVFRVHGTKVASRVGYDLTGKSVEAIPDASARAMVNKLFGSVLERRAPIIGVRDHLRLLHSPVGRAETAALPLSSDGTTIDMLLTAVAWL